MQFLSKHLRTLFDTKFENSEEYWVFVTYSASAYIAALSFVAIIFKMISPILYLIGLVPLSFCLTAFAVSILALSYIYDTYYKEDKKSEDNTKDIED